MNSSNERRYNSARVAEVFGNLAIDKNRLPSSGLTSIGVPSFVGEWLLDKIVPGSGTLTVAEQEKVNAFVRKAFPRKDDKEEVKFDLTQGESHKVIALMQARVDESSGAGTIPEPYARVPVLGFEECLIPVDIIDRNRMLLRQGIWGKISLTMRSDGQIQISDFDPFQCSSVDLEMYADCRRQFSADEWRDIMFCSMGFDPLHQSFTSDAKTWVLARLLPLVEQNYHVIELAPKGTGKSFVYENISSKVSVISGGKVTPARLFLDGKTKQVGLLGRHDVVVLDEVQSLSIDNPDEVLGPLKSYLASGRYNRAGFGDVASDCSLVMLANIELDENQRPRNPNRLLADLPKYLEETAFLDRLAGIIPGWKIPKFQKDMIASGIGLKMDFFGEALFSLRRDTRYLDFAMRHTVFNNTTTIRDQNAILKTASGFLKILYPHLELQVEDFRRDCLELAKELRQRIRDLLYFADEEFRQYGKVIEIDVQ